MAATCPIHFDVATLRREVSAMYTRVAESPNQDFHFHRGPEYAARYLGYDASELAELPARASSRFAGVGNPLAIGPIRPGQTVLDHACGAGMDLLLAARRVGKQGRAIGVDLTRAMREAARLAAFEAGFDDRVDIRNGVFEELPVDDESVHIVISNGVLNLSPDKRQVLREVRRVLKPGGALYLADVVVKRELTLEARSNPDLWASCIGGALLEYELAELTAEAGLESGKVVGRFFSFADTSAERKVSKDLGLGAVNFLAFKA